MGKELDTKLYKQGLIDGFATAIKLSEDKEEIAKYGKTLYKALYSIPEDDLSYYIRKYLEKDPVPDDDYMNALKTGYDFFVCLHEMSVTDRTKIFGTESVKKILNTYQIYYIISKTYHDYIED